jgi:hypothetical protein
MSKTIIVPGVESAIPKIKRSRFRSSEAESRKATTSVREVTAPQRSAEPSRCIRHQRSRPACVGVDKGRPQTIMALVGLDNLYASDNPKRQVRVDYGDKYLEQFAQAHDAAPESPDVYIKMEVD